MRKLSEFDPKTRKRIVAQMVKEDAGKVAIPQPAPAPAVTAVTMLAIINPSTDEDRLNKTEMAYLAYLRALRLPWIGIQCLTFKLADDTRLTPDFSYVNHDARMTMVDVKGFQREDALIKMRVAARQFPMFDWNIVKRCPAGWDITTVKP